jgi:hypothetical protein
VQCESAVVDAYFENVIGLLSMGVCVVREYHMLTPFCTVLFYKVGK